MVIRLFSVLTLSLILSACAIETKDVAAHGEGYSGTDENWRFLRSAQQLSAQFITRPLNTTTFDDMCIPKRCTSCERLGTLTPLERNTIRNMIWKKDYRGGMLPFLADVKAFKLSDTPLIVDGEEKTAVADHAKKQVIFNRKKIENLTLPELLVVWTHETMHLAPFPQGDGVLTDEEPVYAGDGRVAFETGKDFADVAGACVSNHIQQSIAAFMSLTPIVNPLPLE